jgi:hypothetical protein
VALPLGWWSRRPLRPEGAAALLGRAAR